MGKNRLLFLGAGLHTWGVGFTELGPHKALILLKPWALPYTNILRNKSFNPCRRSRPALSGYPIFGQNSIYE
jgi:hypothetical protein